MMISGTWADGRRVWWRLLSAVALAGGIGCNGSVPADTTPSLTLTSSISDTTVAQGSRFNIPFVLTWRNQTVDSVKITLDNRPTNVTVDVNTSSGTVIGNTDTGLLAVIVGFLDPGSYTVDLVAQGAAHSIVSIPFKINVTLAP